MGELDADESKTMDRMGAAIMTCGLIAGWSEWSESSRVTFLDVGQGDAIVVESGRTIGVIDVGGVFQDPNEQKRSTFDPGKMYWPLIYGNVGSVRLILSC